MSATEWRAENGYFISDGEIATFQLGCAEELTRVDSAAANDKAEVC
jgi:hypothetical protein